MRCNDGIQFAQKGERELDYTMVWLTVGKANKSSMVLNKRIRGVFGLL